MNALFRTDEAESHLLAALLSDPARTDDCPLLEPEDFSDPLMGDLFKAIQDRARAGRLVSPAALQVWAEGVGFPFQGLLNMHTFGSTYRSQVQSLSEVIVKNATKRSLLAILEGAATKAAQVSTDPNDLVGIVEKALNGLNARGNTHSGYMTLREAMVASAEAANNPTPPGLRTGYASLDRRLGGFVAGDLVIAAGRPGMGKSAFGMNLARGWGYRGIKGHVASYEMSAEQIGDRSLGSRVRIPYAEIRRNPKTLDKWRLQKAAERGPDCVYIDPSPAQTVPQLQTSARETRRRLGGLDFIIVDYLQLMKPVRKSESRNVDVTEVSQGLKALAKELRVPIIALAQLNRESDKDKRPPQLSELRDSGAIEQDADVVLGLFRPAYFLEQERPDVGSPDFDLWQEKWGVQKNQLFVSTLKQRMGPTGKDELTAELEHDIIRDTQGSFEPRAPRSPMRED